MSPAVFADTYYWISLANPEDAGHARAVAFDLSAARPLVVTTEEVLAEFLTFFGGRGPFLRKKAMVVVNGIIASDRVRVIAQTHATFRAGADLYAARPDKEYSLTDCASMQVMHREGLTDVLTDDRHFEQDGFRALLRR